MNRRGARVGGREGTRATASVAVLQPGQPRGLYRHEEAVYPRLDTALRHGAGTEREMRKEDKPYAPFPAWEPGPSMI